MNLEAEKLVCLSVPLQRNVERELCESAVSWFWVPVFLRIFWDFCPWVVLRANTALLRFFCFSSPPPAIKKKKS